MSQPSWLHRLLYRHVNLLHPRYGEVWLVSRRWVGRRVTVYYRSTPTAAWHVLTAEEFVSMHPGPEENR